MSYQRLADINLATVTPPTNGYMPSPRAWEEIVLYFLLLDRFSDGKEKGYKDVSGQTVTTGTTPLYTPGDLGNAIKTPADAARWQKAGGGYVGGTLQGLKSKIGYLKRLGITAIWVSPVLKQARFAQSYHGYGVQDFLEVNPEFGTAQDLRDLVNVAHDNGIYVVLDIILNHTADIFAYDPARPSHANRVYHDNHGNFDPRWDGDAYDVSGFRDAQSNPSIPFSRTDPNVPASWPSTDAAVWPVEFQDPALFTQRGNINNWDYEPEYLQGDFSGLKDVAHGTGSVDTYLPSPALMHLCEVYKYWVAYADLDGYRVDTVKHMDKGATRLFTSAIHEFARSIGKSNFYLIGEILGGRKNAFETARLTGLDAALGIEEIPDKMEYLVKGFRNPADYFNLFRNSEELGVDSHTWLRDRVVTVFDDHDQVRKGKHKARFCADAGAETVALNVLALNACTLGIPCIYYGSEQGFDGEGSGDGADKYLREAMFGGEFGAFRSRGRHCFDEGGRLYQEVAKVLTIRRNEPALGSGRQYLRQISGDGVHFGYPEMLGGEIRSIVPWSRILSDRELLLALNTESTQARTAWVTIDASLHHAGDRLICLYSNDAAQIGTHVTVAARNGMAMQVTVPAGGFVIYR